MIKKICKYANSAVRMLKAKDKKGLYKYKSYDEYKEAQIKGNLDGIDKCWVKEENIKYLSKLIKNKIPNPKFGICHGTRRGLEQLWFRKYLNIKVIGTEISHTATQFQYTIEWDFHEVKDEWLNKVDFIYSNSFDHSCKPRECLNAWMSCVRKNGILIIEWSNADIESNKLDTFGETLEGYKKMISEEGYKIEKILSAPTNKDFLRTLSKSYFIIISNKK